MTKLQLNISKVATGIYNFRVTHCSTNYTEHYSHIMANIVGLKSILSFLNSPLCIYEHNPYFTGFNVECTDKELVSLCMNVTSAASIYCFCTYDVVTLRGKSIVISFKSPDYGVSTGCPDDRNLAKVHNAYSLADAIKNLPIKKSRGTLSSNYVRSVADAELAARDTKTPRCKFCATPASPTRKVTTSDGTEVELCERCSSTRTCGICSFDEPRFLTSQGIRMNDDTGKNDALYVCQKCVRGLRHCKNCGKYYDHKEYEVCPCLVRMDFKGLIKAFNADVLEYCQMDVHSNELFGVELEVGTLNKNRRMFSEIASSTEELIQNNAILVYDSSIDYINKNDGVENAYKGFEVVTRPMAYKNIVRFLRHFCKSKHALLRSWEVGTCGIHIHVSKACLSRIEIGKILLFVNNKGNRKFIKMIAKREDKRFAKFLTKTIMDYRKNDHSCHYEAINTSKPHTIEFRIFRGTLNIPTIISYLQFVKSLIDFVRITEKDSLTYDRYTDFLMRTERSQFRELKARIKSENLKEIEEKDEI